MSLVRVIALEKDLRKLLVRLLVLFEPGKSRPLSPLDPLSGLVQQTELLRSAVKEIICKHGEIEQLLSVESGGTAEEKFQAWLNEPKLLGCYSTLMSGLLKLLFCSNVTMYRFSINTDFTNTVIRAYKLLRELSLISSVSNAQLLSIIHSFECHFKTHWNTINCTSYHFENVRDLLSHGHDIVCPPLLNLSEVIKRDYFRLTIAKFKYSNILVELFQLSNGELAVFKVNCGKLPHTIDSVKSLLDELSLSYKGRESELGRSLLFPTLRKDDLDIFAENQGNIELKTKTGNGVVLKLSPVDPTQWDTHWKLFFYSLFSTSSTYVDSTGLSYTHMAKSAHPYQNFKLKHDKLDSLRPEGNKGLAMELPRKPQSSISRTMSPRNNGETLLHKSKPLKSSVISDTFDKSPSFSEIEKLNCDKLLELDRSINMTQSPVLEMEALTPKLENFKKVRSSSSMEVADFSLGEYADDGESIISVDDSEEPKDQAVFDLESEYVRPELAKRKSSSLLSLFSANKSKTSLKNKKNLTLNLSSTDSSSSLFALPTPVSSTPTPTSATSSDVQYCQLPNNLELSSSTLLHEFDVKVSYWSRNAWHLLSKNWLLASIYETNKSKLILAISDSKVRDKIVLCSAISASWKLNRSTAQDIQIRIPRGDYISASFSTEGTMMSIRCPQVEQLMNSFYHCIRHSTSPNLMQHSYTQGTLSTTSSTFSMLDRDVTRSDTNSTALSSVLQENISETKENLVSLLLLSNVKVRMHRKDPEYGWTLFNKGKLDLSSLEMKGTVVAVKFELLHDRKNKCEYQSKLEAIRRIGRTGLSFVDFQGEYLIEFKNQEVADSVFKLVTSLI